MRTIQRKSTSVRSLIVCKSMYSVEEHLVFAEGDPIFKVQQFNRQLLRWSNISFTSSTKK